MLKRLLSLALAWIISLILVSLSLYAFKLVLIGVLGLHGRLMDASHRENVLVGVQSFGTALLIWCATLAWFFWLENRPLRLQFGLRSMLIAMTVAAFLLGFAAIAYRALN